MAIVQAWVPGRWGYGITEEDIQYYGPGVVDVPEEALVAWGLRARAGTTMTEEEVNTMVASAVEQPAAPPNMAEQLAQVQELQRQLAAQQTTQPQTGGAPAPQPTARPATQTAQQQSAAGRAAQSGEEK